MPKSVSVRSGQVEFLKLNLQRREYRDIYQWLLALKWPEFAALIAGIYIILNLVFAEFYALAGGSIAGLRSGSYVDAFFFSFQTLATLGYSPEEVESQLTFPIENARDRRLWPLVSANALWSHPHYHRNHRRHVRPRRYDRLDFRPFLPPRGPNSI